MSGNINFDGWINDDGSENYKCRAWVNFNGTGTVAIRASGNVSSITDNGTGDYTVNFTTAMVDADYSFVVSAGDGSSSKSIIASAACQQAPSTSALRILLNNSAFADTDRAYVTVAIFR